MDVNFDSEDEVVGASFGTGAGAAGRSRAFNAGGLTGQKEDDWEQALEALRDRQRWRQQGANRLLAAGFTAEEVRKWEWGSGGRGNGKGVGRGEEMGEDEDVRWGKAGEWREWDRGKVVDEEGEVGVKAEWG